MFQLNSKDIGHNLFKRGPYQKQKVLNGQNLISETESAVQ